MSDGVDLGIPGIGPATLVGQGGFGRVYRAVQLSSGGVVAVKVVAGHLDGTGRERFERETRALGALRGHPNICTVFDAGVDADGRPYLVMELAPTNLAQRLTATGAMSWADASVLGVQLAGALHTAHAGGLLHRDVKPENVLISSFGVPKLADFGLARFTDDTVSRGVTTTVSHAAPELLRGELPSVASDVYALGSTLFAALTGHVAFALTDGAHHASLYRRIEEDPVPELPGVPDAIATVVRTAMAKEPGDRYPSARALGDALRDAQRAVGVPVTPLPLADGEAVETAAAAVVETVDAATPHDPKPAGGLTEAVVRGNRQPVEVEPEAADQTGGRTARRLPRWAPGAAVLAAALLAVGLVTLGGGDGGERDAGTTAETTTTEPSTTTTLSPEEQLAADVELIRQFWTSYSNAGLSSADALQRFVVQRNHPMVEDDLSACPITEAEWRPEMAVLEESRIERDDDFTIPAGASAGVRPSGRVYTTPVRFSFPDDTDGGDQSAEAIPIHTAILDGFAYGFFGC